MYCDLTLRRLRATIFVTYSENVFVALGIRHAPYFYMWPVRLYHILPHYLTKGTIFETSHRT